MTIKCFFKEPRNLLANTSKDVEKGKAVCKQRLLPCGLSSNRLQIQVCGRKMMHVVVSGSDEKTGGRKI